MNVHDLLNNIEERDCKVKINNFVMSEENKLRNFGHQVRRYYREYCDNTSIHGFKYLGEKRTKAEKLWWFLCISLCMGICAYMTLHLFKKWQMSPVFVSFATKGTPIYKIPFPAITICPESRFRQDIFNYTDLYTKKMNNISLSNRDEDMFERLSLLCQVYKELQYKLEPILNDSEKFYKLLHEVAPNFMEGSFCIWMGKKVSCDSILDPIVTDEGLCYTFNTLDRAELLKDDIVHYENFHHTNKSAVGWSLEHGYEKIEHIYAYPRRAILAGAKYSFHIEMTTNKRDLDYLCRTSMLGYKVLLHNPVKIPLVSQEYFTVPVDQAVIVAVQPSMMTTSEQVRSYPAYKRECYFSTERYLRHFKIYSQDNCELECLTNFTLHFCDCVNFYMPHDNDTELCGTGRKTCMEIAERRFTMRNLAQNFQDTYPNLKKKKKKNFHYYDPDCNCLPLCTELEYNMEISQNEWKWYKKYKKFDQNQIHMSKLIIYFKNTHFITSQRNELYGWKDFLANFGGFLGLFSGFSILSLVEMVYFLTIRPMFNRRLYGPNNWAGPEEP